MFLRSREKFISCIHSISEAFFGNTDKYNLNPAPLRLSAAIVIQRMDCLNQRIQNATKIVSSKSLIETGTLCARRVFPRSDLRRAGHCKNRE